MVICFCEDRLAALVRVASLLAQPISGDTAARHSWAVAVRHLLLRLQLTAILAVSMAVVVAARFASLMIALVVMALLAS